MSDANNHESPRIDDDQIQRAEEEAKRARNANSVSTFTETESSMQESDVSGETHNMSSEDSNSDEVFSSESDEGPDLMDQPIRVYDARFKIPA